MQANATNPATSNPATSNKIDRFIISLPDGKVVQRVKWSAIAKRGLSYEIAYSENPQDAVQFKSLDLAMDVMAHIGNCEVYTI